PRTRSSATSTTATSERARSPPAGSAEAPEERHHLLLPEVAGPTQRGPVRRGEPSRLDGLGGGGGGQTPEEPDEGEVAEQGGHVQRRALPFVEREAEPDEQPDGVGPAERDGLDDGSDRPFGRSGAGGHQAVHCGPVAAHAGGEEFVIR